MNFANIYSLNSLIIPTIPDTVEDGVTLASDTAESIDLRNKEHNVNLIQDWWEFYRLNPELTDSIFNHDVVDTDDGVYKDKREVEAFLEEDFEIEVFFKKNTSRFDIRDKAKRGTYQRQWAKKKAYEHFTHKKLRKVLEVPNGAYYKKFNPDYFC